MARSRGSIERMGNEAVLVLTRALAYLPELYNALDDQVAGWPSAGAGGSGDAASTKPEQLAINAVEGHPDMAASDLAQLGELVARIEKSALLVDDIFKRHLTPTIERPKAGPDMWCALHLAIGHCVPRGNKKGDRCNWCADFRSAQGFDPSSEILDARDRGVRITQQLIEKHRPKPTAKESKADRKARKRLEKIAAQEAAMTPEELAAKREAEAEQARAQDAEERAMKRAERVTNSLERIAGAG